MSVKQVTYYKRVCDWPGCESTPHTEFTAWGSVDGVYDDFDYAGWHDGVDDSHYCDGHPTIWASDIEDGEEPPEKPYLLLRDVEPKDDGKAVLIEN